MRGFSEPSVILSRLLTVALLLVIAGTTTFSPVLAHSELTDTDPKENSVLRQAPTGVTLSFNDSVQEQVGAITVTGPDGTRYDEKDSFAASGTQASIDLTEIGEGGRFVVAYRIVSGDGHPVQGSYDFELQLPRESSESPPATQATNPAATPDPNPASAEDDDGAGVIWVLGLGAIGIALIAAIIAVFAKRRRG